MKNTIRFIAGMTLAAGAATAQAPAGPPMGPPMAGGGPVGARSAQMLLARSAELDLSDAQVVKLAGIARKAETRMRARRLAMDSARTRFGQPGDSLARRQFGQRMEADMQKERDLSRTDLRDALAVLTPDQQAKAWEMNARRGRDARGGGMGRGRAPGGGGRGGMGGPGGRGGPGGAGQDRPMRPRRGPDDMGPPDGMGPGGRGGDRPVRPMPRMRRPENDGLPPVSEF